MAIQSVWTRDVAAINGLDLADTQLREFLFGAERIGLNQITTGLRELGYTTCFWCGRRLTAKVQVDHVIPWSYYANNEIFNLVLSDAACNGNKSDRLVTPDLIERWLVRDEVELSELSSGLRWPMEPQRSIDVASSAYRWLTPGVPVWQGRGEVRPYTNGDRRRVLRALGQRAAKSKA